MDDELKAELMQRTARCIRTGKTPLSMDDITGNGTVAIDPLHLPNSKQSALGHFLPTLANKGYLRNSGRTVKSLSPARKKGRQLLWDVTPSGVRWAIDFPDVVSPVNGAQGHPALPDADADPPRRRLVRRRVAAPEAPLPVQRRPDGGRRLIKRRQRPASSAAPRPQG